MDAVDIVKKKHRKKEKMNWRPYKPIFKYSIYAAIILTAITLVYMVWPEASTLKGYLTLSIDNRQVQTGEITHISMKATNSGEEPIIGAFNLSADDPQNVQIQIRDQDLLQINLLQGESIERRIAVNATSKAYKTVYELTGSIVSNNNETILATEQILLEVTR